MAEDVAAEVTSLTNEQAAAPSASLLQRDYLTVSAKPLLEPTALAHRWPRRRRASSTTTDTTAYAHDAKSRSAAVTGDPVTTAAGAGPLATPHVLRRHPLDLCRNL